MSRFISSIFQKKAFFFAQQTERNLITWALKIVPRTMMVQAKSFTQEQDLQCGKQKWQYQLVWKRRKVYDEKSSTVILFSHETNDLTGTAVIPWDNTLIDLNVPQAVIGLYKVLGSEGLALLGEKLQDKIKSHNVCPSMMCHTFSELVSSSFILEIPTPGLVDCPSRGNKVLVNKAIRLILHRAVCSKSFYNPRQPRLDAVVIEIGEWIKAY